jgi:hypothetical protein
MRILSLICQPYIRFKNEVTSQDILKSIAIVTMIIDHLGYFFFPQEQWMRAVGRCSAPIWFFFVGYNYKISNIFISKIFYIAIILFMAGCFSTKINVLHVNVLFSMLICKQMLSYYVDEIKINLNFIELLLLAFLSFVLYPLTNSLFEYGTLGIYLAFWGYNYKHGIGNNSLQAILCFILICLTQIISFNLNFNNIIISIILLCLTLYALYIYRPVTFNIQGVSKYIINISSRYSLYIYIAFI